MATLESLVRSRAMCKALKKAGFPQSGLFSWGKSRGAPYNSVPGGQWALQFDVEENEPNALEIVRAPTLQEVLEELRTMGYAVTLEVSSAGNCTMVAVNERFKVHPIANVPSPVEAAAQLWLRVKGESRDSRLDPVVIKRRSHIARPLGGAMRRSDCTPACWECPTCAVCKRPKPPWGRRVAPEMATSYCEHECPGHDELPRAGHHWPGEECDEFCPGYEEVSDE